MAKKIGILTYFDFDQNPGTFLQAHSMLEAIQRRFPGDRVELIDCRPRRARFLIGRQHANINRLIEDYKHYLTYKKLTKQCLKTSLGSIITDDYQRASEFIEEQNYDLILVGADTVLELLPSYACSGQVPIYWLPPHIKCLKVACSASAGALTYNSLDDKYKKVFSDSINDFDLVGVRDDATYNLIKALGLKDESKLEMIPDPTFSLDTDYDPIETLFKRKRVDFSQPTVAINLPARLQLCKELVQHYRSRGCGVVLMSYGSRNLPNMSPLEWAGVYKYFCLTVTDRFHGIIFSLKSKTPVVAVDWEKRKVTDDGLSKTYSCLRLFDLHQSNHINLETVSDTAQVLQIADAAMDEFRPENVDQIVEQFKRKFNAFLDRIASLLD